MGEPARKLEENHPITVASPRRYSSADIRAALLGRVGPIETGQEADGRWFARVVDVEGAFARGATLEAAIEEVKEIGLRLIRERTAADLEATFKAMPGDFLAELDAIGTSPRRRTK